MTEMFGGSVPSSYRRRRDMESATFDPVTTRPTTRTGSVQHQCLWKEMTGALLPPPGKGEESECDQRYCE
jgi:hypothetical protein